LFPWSIIELLYILSHITESKRQFMSWQNFLKQRKEFLPSEFLTILAINSVFKLLVAFIKILLLN